MMMMSPQSTQSRNKTKQKQKGNVLIVEDDAGMAEVMGVALLQAGYGVKAVHSRDDAVPMLEKNIYQFILLDFFTPGIDAAQFVAFVRARSPLSKIILITDQTIVSQEAKGLGLSHWIGKPFDPDQLLSLIASLA